MGDSNQQEGQLSLRDKLLRLTALRHELMPSLLKTLRVDDRESPAARLGVVLQCHLFVESALVELMRLSLGRHAEAVLAARLSFDQKLTIVSRLELHEGFELLPTNVTASLRNLNAIRNKVAHRLGHEIDDDDVRRLFVGLDDDLPYGDVMEHGQTVALSRYTACIGGHMLPKYEICDDGSADDAAKSV